MEWNLHLYRRQPPKPVVNLEAMYDTEGRNNPAAFVADDAVGRRRVHLRHGPLSVALRSCQARLLAAGDDASQFAADDAPARLLREPVLVEAGPGSRAGAEPAGPLDGAVVFRGHGRS